jgi:hypothetical protein
VIAAAATVGAATCDTDAAFEALGEQALRARPLNAKRKYLPLQRSTDIAFILQY